MNDLSLTMCITNIVSIHNLFVRGYVNFQTTRRHMLEKYIVFVPAV